MTCGIWNQVHKPTIKICFHSLSSHFPDVQAAWERLEDELLPTMVMQQKQDNLKCMVLPHGVLGCQMATMLTTPMAMLPMVSNMGTMPTTTQVVAFRTTGVDTAVVASAAAAVVVEMGMVTTTVTAMFTPVGTVTATGHGATAVVEMETGLGMVGCPKLVRAKMQP